jgi:nucleotide-binding universal stress UspA family protein
MTLVVGHAPRHNDRSAISLAAMTARALDTDLLVVSVVPAPWPTPVAGNTDREYVAFARAEGAAAVAEAETVLAEVASDLSARAVSVAGRSVPGTLLEQAAAIDAGMVVVGSGSNGAWGTVVLSSTSDRLLHSAHLPVAVATRGFSTHAAPRLTRATCAFRADQTSRSVLRLAAEMCSAAGAELRVVTFGVLGRTMHPPEVSGGEREVLGAFVEQATSAQAAAIAEVGADVTEVLVATGRSWQEALAGVDWRHGDVLVVGSSSGGVLARVFLGSNATRVVRHSPVPVIVVPA